MTANPEGCRAPLLDVSDLWVRFSTHDGTVQAVRGLSFTVEAGQTLGIVGESGSGKSVATHAILGFSPGASVEGRALFEQRDLLRMSRQELQAVRGARIGMIFQDPLSSLHPMYRVGWQIAEAIRAHDRSIRKRDAHNRAVELLGTVGIPQPGRRVDDFPHQFSGGMRQRVMIAMAMALNPALLIADEPTTALDVTIQAQILELLRQLNEEFGTAIIMITHDLGVIAEVADEVVVMYAGTVLEVADRRELFYEHHHPYTEGLLRSLPGMAGERERLVPIDGQPPSPIDPSPGCAFTPRCPYRLERCAVEQPVLSSISGRTGHRSACWLPKEPAEREDLRARVTNPAALPVADR